MAKLTVGSRGTHRQSVPLHLFYHILRLMPNRMFLTAEILETQQVAEQVTVSEQPKREGRRFHRPEPSAPQLELTAIRGEAFTWRSIGDCERFFEARTIATCGSTPQPERYRRVPTRSSSVSSEIKSHLK